MKHRMVTAALSLLGLYLALYLSLWKLGLVGSMVCGLGSCEVVQTSRYAYLFGVPVAFYGVGGYLAILIASLVGLQPRFRSSVGVTQLLVALGGVGTAFSLYLTYVEAFVLSAWCRWCVVSALLIFGVFGTALWGLREQAAES